MLNPVRTGEELDPQKVASYLFEKELIEDKNVTLNILQFSNGFSNLTYLLQIGNKEYVLRMPPKGAIKRGHDMSREYKVLSKLHTHFDKAPKTYAFEAGNEILGASFYIMEKMEGVVINYKEAVARKISPEAFKIISNSWLDTFVEFHNLDYKKVGLQDLGKPEGYVERQVTNWSKQFVKAKTQEIPAADFVMKWIHEHQPNVYDHTIIHNDFKYDNVVFQENNWTKLNAILDWEMCTLGDPLMDLGASLAYWTTPADGPAASMGIPSPTILPGNPSRTDIVQMYAERSGRSINHLTFYYAFGLFKIAVIAQQIYYRYDKGLTSNKKFAHLNQVCEFLCMIAQQAIQKDKIEGLF